MIKSRFLRLCPNCGGDITDERLFKGLPCPQCLPAEGLPFKDGLKSGEVYEFLKVLDELTSWSTHFEAHMKSSPWGLQTAWAKRVFLGRSFALLAPTGVGKTSFGVSIASFFSLKDFRSYIIAPTIILVKQITDKLLHFGVKEEEILSFGEEDSRSELKVKRDRLKSGDFRILVSTSMFLYRNYNDIPPGFDFVFVDDVDSFLKTARNIDKALIILGFDSKDVQETLQYILFKRKPKKTSEDFEKLREWEEKIKDISRKRRGVLVVSSATSSPKSFRVELFRELLGFEVGTPTFYLRNVEDLYDRSGEKSLFEWIKTLGKGGLVFLSADQGKERVKEVVGELESKGIRAVSYEDIDDLAIRDFEDGKIDIFVGIASYRNPLSRGVDLPHAIRYAIFLGVPKIVISLKIETNPTHLLWALSSIRKHLARTNPAKLKTIDIFMQRLKRLEDINLKKLPENSLVRSRFESLRREVLELLNSADVVEFMKGSPEINLRQTPEGLEMIVSDATGYLQASGRTSRMYGGGITKGLSLILVDDEAAFSHLVKKVKWFNDEIEFKDVSNVDLHSILETIDRDRQTLKAYKEGKISIEKKDLLKPVLIIVESPNKARTIARFFGKPIRRKVGAHDLLETSVDDKYLVITASLGHVLDLNKEVGYHGTLLEDKVVPVYEPVEGKDEIISSIRKMAMECEEVLVATDPDTEGEKIAWDLYGLLKSFAPKIRRMEFHEVTRKAILNGLRNPRDLNLDLVKAQILRRISDRWVGFEFSEYIQRRFGKKSLSAGRVQTPILGWIIEREKKYYRKLYKVEIYAGAGERKLKVDFTFSDEDEAREFFENLETLEISKIEDKIVEANPLPPYRTDTMLQDASNKLKFSLPKTMELAQDLFEMGYITYHRTDSVRVSDAGIKIAREIIEEDFGKEYFVQRSWGEGGAHECIRPARALDPEDLKSLVFSGETEYLNYDHLALYEMIFKRFIASEMRPLKVREQHVEVKALNLKQEIKLKVEVLEDGWNKVIPLHLDPEPPSSINVTRTKRFRTVPEAYPYTQGELVSEMKEKGIGRPSTYATIIEKLFERSYVVERNGFLLPTHLGKRVYAFLNSKEKIRAFVSEEFTRILEKLMDEVEEGKKDHQEILLDILDKMREIRKEQGFASFV